MTGVSKKIEFKLKELNELINNLNNSAFELITASSILECKYRKLKKLGNKRIKPYSLIENKIDELMLEYKVQPNLTNKEKNMQTTNSFFKIVIFVLILSGTLNAQWVTLASGTSSNINDVWLFDQNTGYFCGPSGMVKKTTDGGNSWVSLNSATNRDIYSIKGINANMLFICGGNGIIKRTTNGGTTWDSLYSGFFSQLNDIDFLNSMTGIAIGVSNGGVLTTNSGATWSLEPLFGLNPYVNTKSAYFADSLNVYIGGTMVPIPPIINYRGFVLKSTNGGNSFSSVLNINDDTLSTLNSIQCLFFFNSLTGFAGVSVNTNNGKIYKTTNGGLNWNSVNAGFEVYGMCFLNPNTGYVCGSGGNIRLTTNGGSTWLTQSSGVNNKLNKVSFVSPAFGLCTGDNGILLRTTNGGGVFTGINSLGGSVPDEYLLSQNYPNPFNPTTKIKFNIPGASFVNLFVYDVTAKLIESLLTRNLNSGTYEIDWNAAKYSSGVYFYRIDAGDFSDVKKMILIK